MGCESSPNFAGAYDLADNWKVECSYDAWRRDVAFVLQHVQTGAYMHHDMKSVYRRPISGQREISAVANKDKNSEWVVQEGVYVAVNPSAQAEQLAHADVTHDEF